MRRIVLTLARHAEAAVNIALAPGVSPAIIKWIWALHDIRPNPIPREQQLTAPPMEWRIHDQLLPAHDKIQAATPLPPEIIKSTLSNQAKLSYYILPCTHGFSWLMHDYRLSSKHGHRKPIKSITKKSSTFHG